MSIHPHMVYQANGKLLLSAEYFVLDGALALALPTRLGQKMTVEKNTKTDSIIDWKSHSVDGHIWFQGSFDAESFRCIDSSSTDIAERLVQILSAIRQIHPGFLSPRQSFRISTELDFPREWGLGTSSTLIAMLAQWTGVDPYRLLEATFGGSGYDLACANKDEPILYQKTPNRPRVENAQFCPPFKEQLYFAYLGKKQNSRDGIRHYRQKKKHKESLIEEVSSLTDTMCNSHSLEDFSKALDRHENLVGDFIDMTPVKAQYFSDYWGSIKSLGAWGGDFVLLTSDRSPKETKDYCNEKGLNVFFKYDELIK